jgi:hypothetical protein
MSPYLGPSRRIAGQDFIRIFVQELAQAALVELAREGGGVREHRT